MTKVHLESTTCLHDSIWLGIDGISHMTVPEDMPQDAGQNHAQFPSENLGVRVSPNSLLGSFSDARGASRKNLQLLKRRSEVGLSLTRRLRTVAALASPRL